MMILSHFLAYNHVIFSYYLYDKVQSFHMICKTFMIWPLPAIQTCPVLSSFLLGPSYVIPFSFCSSLCFSIQILNKLHFLKHSMFSESSGPSHRTFPASYLNYVPPLVLSLHIIRLSSIPWPILIYVRCPSPYVPVTPCSCSVVAFCLIDIVF